MTILSLGAKLTWAAGRVTGEFVPVLARILIAEYCKASAQALGRRLRLDQEWAGILKALMSLAGELAVGPEA